LEPGATRVEKRRVGVRDPAARPRVNTGPPTGRRMRCDEPRAYLDAENWLGEFHDDWELLKLAPLLVGSSLVDVGSRQKCRSLSLWFAMEL